MMRIRAPFTIGLCILLAGLWAHNVAAQTGANYSATSATDVYGNVRPVYLDYRSVGSYRSEAERLAFRGFQTLGRRVDRRGGYTPYALPGDVFTRPRGRVPHRRASLLLADMWSSERRQAFKSYGGFGTRRVNPQTRGIASALERRHALIAATSLNAPVHRAALTANAAVGFRPMRSPALLVSTGVMESEAVEPTVTLEQRLRSSADRAHQRVRVEAWEWFRAGEFRRAARGFETAVSLEPADAESRIGELFSQVSLGAMRTALVVLRELNRHDDDPFLHDLNLTNAYGDPAQPRRLRLGLPFRAMGHSANPDARALYVLVLWYLGERDEAIIGATTLAGELSSGTYADWPAKMRAARASLAAENGPSQP